MADEGLLTLYAAWAAAAAGHRPAGALEATTTGLHRLEGLEIPFPVLDWNGIALKELIHNRHPVGVETWPMEAVFARSTPDRAWNSVGRIGLLVMIETRLVHACRQHGSCDRHPILDRTNA